MSVKFHKVYDFIKDGTEPQAINTIRTVNIEGTHITLVRITDGYFALSDKCAHAGGRLGQGKCTSDGHVMCPVHRYQYDIKTGKGLPRQGDYVDIYPTETRTDGVYVGLKIKWWKMF